MESWTVVGWRMTHGINSENKFTVGAWNQQRKQSHCWRVESVVKTASMLTRNRQWKLSDSRPRNHHWKLSDSWRTESTASMNSRPTHDIDSQNIVMGDAWNRQKHYVTADAEVVGEIWVTLEREIIIENWVTDDAWNRQRKLIHGLEIINGNWATLDLENISEKWVTADVWNR